MPTLIIIHGVSSAVGSYAVEFARLSDLHPVILLAGPTSTNISPLPDSTEGDLLLDNRQTQLAELMNKTNTNEEIRKSIEV